MRCERIYAGKELSCDKMAPPYKNRAITGCILIGKQLFCRYVNYSIDTVTVVYRLYADDHDFAYVAAIEKIIVQRSFTKR